MGAQFGGYLADIGDLFAGNPWGLLLVAPFFITVGIVVVVKILASLGG